MLHDSHKSDNFKFESKHLLYMQVSFKLVYSEEQLV